MASFSVRTLGFPQVRCDDRLCPLALRKGLALLVLYGSSEGPGRARCNCDHVVARKALRRWSGHGRVGCCIAFSSRSAMSSPPTDPRFGCRRRSICTSIYACSKRLATAATSSTPAISIKPTSSTGFSRGECPQFDEWAFFRREALRGRAIQALERVVQEKHAAADYASAAAHAGRLVALDPLSEIYARHVIRNLLLGGDRAAAERHLKALTQRLRDELDVAPEAETNALLAAAAAEPPPTQYVSGGSVHLAFQTYGRGRIDVLMLPGFVSHVERVWEEARCRAFLSSLATTGRLVLFDRRGVGLSDRVGFSPSAEATAQDIRTVLDAAGSRRVVLFGASEGGPACIRFAADHPDRVAGLILFASLAKGSAAPDYPYALQADQYDAWLQQLVRPGAGLPELRRSPEFSPAMPRREPGGPACFVRPQARAPSGACSRPCEIRMCGMFSAGSRSDAGAPPPWRPRGPHRRRKTSCQPHPAGALHRTRRRRSLGLRRRSASGA